MSRNIVILQETVVEDGKALPTGIAGPIPVEGVGSGSGQVRVQDSSRDRQYLRNTQQARPTRLACHLLCTNIKSALEGFLKCSNLRLLRGIERSMQ